MVLDTNALADAHGGAYCDVTGTTVRPHCSRCLSRYQQSGQSGRQVVWEEGGPQGPCWPVEGGSSFHTPCAVVGVRSLAQVQRHWALVAPAAAPPGPGCCCTLGDPAQGLAGEAATCGPAPTALHPRVDLHPQVSPCGRYVAYGVDTCGEEDYAVHVATIGGTGVDSSSVGPLALGCTGDLAWGSDAHSLYYVHKVCTRLQWPAPERGACACAALPHAPHGAQQSEWRGPGLWAESIELGESPAACSVTPPCRLTSGMLLGGCAGRGGCTHVSAAPASGPEHAGPLIRALIRTGGSSRRSRRGCWGGAGLPRRRGGPQPFTTAQL